MKAQTRRYKNEYSKDISRVTRNNHSKDTRRTPEERVQAAADKMTFYRNKWERMMAEATTTAQRNYCRGILNRI